MRKIIFLKNAVILTITAFLLRSLGIVLRVYMSNKIGAEGVGLYQMVFSIYVLASTFATAGISTAVIRIISEELTNGNKKTVLAALKKCLKISVSLGIISTITIFLSADFIGKYWLNDVRTIPALKILVFAFPFMSITSCIKGYFIARRKVSVHSNAQLLEQLVRISLIYFLLNSFASYGIGVSCFVIMLGDVISEASSCLYSYLCFIHDKKKLSNHIVASSKRTPILKTFFYIALPIAGNKYVNSILHTIENLLVPDSLRKFTSSRETSLEQFGMLKGMALPILFFPSSFLNALSTLLIPEMSEASILHQKQKVHNVVERTMHFTLTASILIGGLFFIFAYDLGTLIYKSSEVGFLIKVLAPIIPFMYLESMVMGILQGLNQQMESLKYSIIDSFIRIILVFFIVPKYGLNGFLFIMIISNISTSSLNVKRLLNVANVKLNVSKWIIKPLLAFVVSAFVLYLIVPFISYSLVVYLVIGISVTSVIYVLVLFITKALTKEDLFLRS